MKEIGGFNIPDFPISGLKHVKDLLYHEGPLLSQYAHPNGDTYLFHWCDCDDQRNRWMILRVNEAMVLRLVNRFLPLDQVIPKACRDDFVYFVDTDGREERAVKMVPLSEIPSDYLPQAGAYLDADVRQRLGARTFSVVVEGGWSVDAIGEFPNVFGKAYSLLYALNVLHLPKFEGFPWRGGFSAMHFFNWLGKRIPAGDRPTVAAMQYSSPGFMRFALDAATARQVTQCVSDYMLNRRTMGGAYSDLYKYIREFQLNDEIQIDWSQHDLILNRKTKEILSGFGSINAEAFVTTCERPFEAAKIAAAFYRFIRQLYDFQDDGLVQFSQFAD